MHVHMHMPNEQMDGLSRVMDPVLDRYKKA
jgi:hypothetical protein